MGTLLFEDLPDLQMDFEPKKKKTTTNITLSTWLKTKGKVKKRKSYRKSKEFDTYKVHTNFKPQEAPNFKCA